MKSTPRDYARAYVELAQLAKPSELTKVGEYFWSLVWKRRHFGWRQLIVAEVERFMQEQAGIVPAEVASAKPLSPAAAKKIETELKVGLGQAIKVDFVVKPHLLAGVVITTQDKKFDASLKGRLDALYTQLVGSGKA